MEMKVSKMKSIIVHLKAGVEKILFFKKIKIRTKQSLFMMFLGTGYFSRYTNSVFDC